MDEFRWPEAADALQAAHEDAATELVRYVRHAARLGWPVGPLFVALTELEEASALAEQAMSRVAEIILRAAAERRRNADIGINDR